MYAEINSFSFAGSMHQPINNFIKCVIRLHFQPYIYIYAGLDLRIKKWLAIFWSSPQNCESLFKLICSGFAIYSHFCSLLHKTLLKEGWGPKKGLFANPFAKVIRNRPKRFAETPKILRISWPKWFTITPKVISIWRCDTAYFQPCMYVYIWKWVYVCVFIYRLSY